jgi:hypothetical protein
MKLLAVIIASGVAAAIALVSQAQDRSAQICGADIQGAVAAALKHSLEDAVDLPDLGIVSHEHGMVYVLDYLSENNCLLDKTVLPASTTRMYVLASREQLVELARQHEDGIAYVRAGDVQVGNEESWFWLGVSMQPAPGDHRLLVCCCGGMVVLRRSANQWVFQEWKNKMCA